MNTITVPFFISHQGCPHRCVFCDQEKIAGAAGKLPTPEEIHAKIGLFAESARERSVEVAFFGGSFTALARGEQRALLEPLQELLGSGELCGVRISTRPDALDSSDAFFLKEMGVRTVELGVQSLDDEVLRLSGRGHSAADVADAARAVVEAGLALGIQLMPGLPGDNRQRSLSSLRQSLSLSPSFLRIYPTLVLAGTALAALQAAGEYCPLTLEEAVQLCKEMLLLAKRHQVPVLRMGLQPTSELEAPGVLLAGPYHPAFGQLVESELYFDLLSFLLAPLPDNSRVTVLAPAGRTSDVLGQKRRNAVRLAERHGVVVQTVREDAAVAPDSLVVCWEGGRFQGELSQLALNP